MGLSSSFRRIAFTTLALGLGACLQGCQAPAPADGVGAPPVAATGVRTQAGSLAALPASARPRLLAVFVVDGLPERQVLAYRDQLAPDGLARFLERGAWFGDAHHGHAYTVTAAGHASIFTGAYPQRHGIIANEWRDALTGAVEYCTADMAASYIGNKTQPLDGTSPKNLKVDTIGDVLRRADARAKVISISGKDRGAILPAGKMGVAYMYMSQSGQFASSTYYMAQHPAWVNAFNNSKSADRWFRKEWKPLLPEAAYARSLPDRQPWYGPRGGALPMLMGSANETTPGPIYYAQLLTSPFADQLTLEFARAAIAGEGLGSDDVPDLLTISLSGHDYVNHRYSAESRLSQDHLLQLDRLLQEFLRHLDATVGRDNYLAVLTADHGFMPAPEFAAQQGLRAGRINGVQMLARINAGLEEEFGAGRWVSFSGATLLLNKQLIAKQNVDPDDVAEMARALILEEPGIAAAYTRGELVSGSRVDAPFFNAAQRAWHADVSGDVQIILKPYWMFASTTAIASHGSPYPYDTNVPILLWGPRWVKPGRIDERVEVVDIAPTLAYWLGVAPPATAQGTPLPLPR